MTQNQFNVLTVIEKKKEKLSQRELAKETNLSIGTINRVIMELNKKNLIDQNNLITGKGLKALSPYRVKRAIFLAAGFGSRLVPITLNTPKPLVKVHGKRMIETLLDAVVSAEIPEIIIVRGYLSEEFSVLIQKYPHIKFIENPLYIESNNISSVYQVKDKLANAYVLESDLVLLNPHLIRKYEYTSNILGSYVEETNDWCVEVKKNIIVNEKIGGRGCYQMKGITFFDKVDGLKLRKDYDEVFHSLGGKEVYYSQVPLVFKKKNYQIRIRPCDSKDIIEIDTFSELKQIDKSYDV